MSVFIEKKNGERGLLPLFSHGTGVGAGRPLGSRLRATHRACSLCLFCLVPSEGHGSSRVFSILGERGSGEMQENKPLLPLLLRVQGKKENNAV